MSKDIETKASDTKDQSARDNLHRIIMRNGSSVSFTPYRGKLFIGVDMANGSDYTPVTTLPLKL